MSSNVDLTCNQIDQRLRKLYLVYFHNFYSKSKFLVFGIVHVPQVLVQCHIFPQLLKVKINSKAKFHSFWKTVIVFPHSKSKIHRFWQNTIFFTIEDQRFQSIIIFTLVNFREKQLELIIVVFIEVVTLVYRLEFALLNNSENPNK